MYLDDRELTSEGKDDGHLKKDAEGIANVVGSEFLEALCTVAALTADKTEERRGRGGIENVAPRTMIRSDED